MQSIHPHPKNEREGERGARSPRWAAFVVVGVLGWIGAFAVPSATALSAAGVYREAASSVVVVFGLGKGASGSSGTGTILTSDGLVLTNDHVITRQKDGRLYRDLIVYFKPDPISGDNSQDLRTAYLVEVVARSAELDLALLRVQNPPANLRPIVVGDSEEIEVGESVAAIGHPGGGGLWTLTTGTISSKRRDGSREIFQTDTAINPGNSGGPLLDENARLVGVNTFVRRVNEKGLPLEGLNYSLRSRTALAWVNRQVDRPVELVSRPAPSRSRPPEIASGRESRPRTPAANPKTNKRSDRDRDRSRAVDAPRFPALLPGGAQLAAPSTPRKSWRPDPSREARESRSTPRVVEQERRERPPEPGFRRFRGPRGETLYGVPNPEVGLRDTLRQARRGFRAVTERADESIDEMEDRLDQYENF